MLIWFRLRASLMAAIVLLSMGASSASLLGGHPVDRHDQDHLAATVAHDAAAHRFEGEPTETHGEPVHCCLACHFARTFRSKVVTTFDAAPATSAGDSVPLDIVAVARNTSMSQPPLRSPPSSPLPS